MTFSPSLVVAAIFVIRPWSLAEGAVPCGPEYGLDVTDRAVREDGSVVLGDIVFSAGQLLRTGNGKVTGCVCDVRSCLRKCCPMGQFLLNRTTCAPTTAVFSLPRIESYHIVDGHGCPPDTQRSLLPYGEFEVAEDGTLVLSGTGKVFHQAHYCVDHVLTDDEIKGLVCVQEEASATHANVVGMMVSMPFLLLTFLVYALLPDRNLHGKSLMCYVLSLFGAYAFLVAIQLQSGDLNNDDDDTACVTIGILCLFFFMVSFFWMNVMSVDIWWTFSGLRGFSGSKRDTERKRFILYSSYAWGAPLLLVVLVTALTVSPNVTSQNWYNPGLGEGQCWLSDGIPTLIYFYGPIAVLVASNIILFGTTAWKIRRVQRDTAMLRKGRDSKTHGYEKDKQRFNLYLKLLLAMGVNWSMEIISWAVSLQFGTVPNAVWYLTDFCNALYGVFIFLVFTCKRNIWILLRKRYYILIGKPHLARTFTVNDTPSSPRTTVSSVGTKASSHVKYSTRNSTVHVQVT